MLCFVVSGVGGGWPKTARLCYVRTHILTPLLGVAVDDLTSAELQGKQPEETQELSLVLLEQNKCKTESNESNKMSLEYW